MNEEQVIFIPLLDGRFIPAFMSDIEALIEHGMLKVTRDDNGLPVCLSLTQAAYDFVDEHNQATGDTPHGPDRI